MVAVVIGYRDRDHGPREPRVDLIDPQRLVTLASLDPESALHLAAELVMRALQAKRERELGQ